MGSQQVNKLIQWKRAGGMNGALRRFNQWFDEFVIATAKPLAMLGFAMGTVDIFTRGGLAVTYWFSLAWAIIQAVTVDGLFFAVWYRVFGLRWEPGSRVKIVSYTAIGLVLALVAFATNDILGFQQLWGIPDSQVAMIRLGIPPPAFTYVRAVLVVLVAVMVAYVYRTGDTLEQAESSVSVAPVAQESTMRSIPVAPVTPAIAERSTGVAGRSTDTPDSATDSGAIDEYSAGVAQRSAERSTDNPGNSATVAQRSMDELDGPEEPTLGFIEQQMYSTLLGHPEEARALLKEAETRSPAELATVLRERYPGYASYITERRVANVLRYARYKQAGVAQPVAEGRALATSKQAAIIRPGTPMSKEVIMEELARNPMADLKKMAQETGVAYSTLTKYRRLVGQKETAD